MATRTFTVVVSITIENPDVEEITDEMVDNFSADCMYCFPDTDEVTVKDAVWEETNY